jgi:hypothetical protein
MINFTRAMMAGNCRSVDVGEGMEVMVYVLSTGMSRINPTRVAQIIQSDANDHHEPGFNSWVNRPTWVRRQDVVDQNGKPLFD